MIIKVFIYDPSEDYLFDWFESSSPREVIDWLVSSINLLQRPLKVHYRCFVKRL